MSNQDRSEGIPTARDVDHVSMMVPDLNDAEAFLVDVLGCEPLYRAGPFDDPEGDWMAVELGVHPRAQLSIAMVRCGPTTNIELLEFEAPDQNEDVPKNSDIGASHLAFYVDDMQAAVEYLESQADVEVMGEPATVEEGPSRELQLSISLRCGARSSNSSGFHPSCPTSTIPIRNTTNQPRTGGIDPTTSKSETRGTEMNHL
jgi:catechol 2,3-dioxygenase-like lactoylglutathione lyase family enzyme